MREKRNRAIKSIVLGGLYQRKYTEKKMLMN